MIGKNNLATRGWLGVAMVFAVVAHGERADAGLSRLPSSSWSSTSVNGKYLFVFLFPQPINEQVALIHECEPKKDHAILEMETRRLHATYPRTGMYRNDGSTTPIWTPSERIDGGVPTNDGNRVVDYGSGRLTIAVIYEPNRAPRYLNDFDVMGYPERVLLIASGEAIPWVDGRLLTNAGESLLVEFSNGSSATVRLDDFAIVRSNILSNALFDLFTTAQGIAVVVVVTLLASGMIYVVYAWWSAPKRDVA